MDKMDSDDAIIYEAVLKHLDESFILFNNYFTIDSVEIKGLLTFDKDDVLHTFIKTGPLKKQV